jgi:hypothetical protein
VSRRLLGPALVLAVALTGCAGPDVASSSRLSTPLVVSVGAAQHLPKGVPGTFVGLSNGRRSTVGLYSSATGRRIRGLSHTTDDQVLALGDHGKALFLSDGDADQRRPCTRRVSLVSGASHALPICATGLAISSDGRMLAYTAVAHNGLTIALVIRDRATGRHRSVVLYRNCKGCNNAVEGAALAWAPDDRHLAVSIGYTAAIQSLQVLGAWHGTIAKTPATERCNGEHTACEDPAYDSSGRLIFTRFGPQFGEVAEVRLSGHKLRTLHRFSAHRYFGNPVVDSAGNAFIWQNRTKQGRPAGTYVWVRGHVHLLLGAVRSRAVLPLLWN